MYEILYQILSIYVILPIYYMLSLYEMLSVYEMSYMDLILSTCLKNYYYIKYI